MKKVITLFMLVCLTVAVMAATVFKPGTYTGQAKGRNGTVSVEVTVDGSKITAVKVLEHQETASIGSAAIEQIPGRIVSGQTLAVDAASGASLTSRAILSAAEEALTKAANGDISQFMIKRQTQTAQKLKDEQTDVVIIGAGGAGMIAAIAVAQSGKNVILIEKQGLLGGGDSALTSTSVRGGGSRLISKLGIENATTEDFYNYLAKTAADKNIAADLDSLRVYAMRSGELIDYLTDLGVPFGKFNAASFSHTMTDGSAPGTHVVPALAREVVKNKIDYRLNTKAVSIIMNKGKAAGIAVESPDGKYNINAKEVITTGGYSANPELVAKYAPQWTNRPTTGAASLTGDGILMAEAVGADINNMEVVKANFLCYVLHSGDGV